MISSFAISVVFLILARNGVHVETAVALLITVVLTTICWLTAAFLGPETDRSVLVAFYKRVRPFGPGWRRIREEAGISAQDAAATRENIPLSLLGWVTGCSAIWSSLFTVGNFLYGRMGYAIALLAVFAVSVAGLVFVMRRLWSDSGDTVTS
jgi:hypothetical protein